MYMLDTNICIEVIRRHRRNKILIDRLTAHSPGDIGISTIVLAELEYGVSKSSEPLRNARALMKFCAPFEIVPFDAEAAYVYGQIRSALEKKGTLIGPMDMLIAAHAIAFDAILVTNNTREFRRIKDLKLANWTRK